MQFPTTLTEGRLIRRYARFLADVELQDGTVVTAHTANTGSMLGCSEAGSRVWLSRSKNPKRKYPFTWEIVETSDGILVGINTSLSNTLVEEAITDGIIQELQGYGTIRREVPYGSENSRIDLLLERHANKPDCYVEVKNVTAIVNQTIAVFPDAVSQRGSKHLRELQKMVDIGKRDVVCFCIQRGDARQFQPAHHIDMVYAETLYKVMQHGVEAIAYDARVDCTGIRLHQSRPVVLS